MSKRVQRLGYTAASLASVTGLQRELIVDMTNWTVTVHDGSTVGGYSLMRADGTNGSLVINAGAKGLMSGGDKTKLDLYPTYGNPFVLNAGAANAPAIQIVGSLTTGIFSPAANVVAVTISGTEQFRIDATGLANGVGAAAASADHLYRTNAVATLYQNSNTNASGGAVSTNGTSVGLNNTGGYVINQQYVNANGTIQLAIAGSTKLGINSNGYVILGDAVTGGKGTQPLQIKSAATFYGASSAVTGFTVGISGTVDAQILNTENGKLFLGTNGTNVITISGTDVGIGVTPSAWSTAWDVLQVGDTGIGNSNTAGTSVTYLGTNWYYNGANDVYINTGYAVRYAQISGAHRWDLAASGTAGANISFTPAMTLDINGHIGVGTANNAFHSIASSVSNDAGNINFVVGTAPNGSSASTNSSLVVYNVSGTGANAANAAVMVQKDYVTSRSIKCAGTVGASGADYAEYRRLVAAYYRAIAKGQLIGYNANGEMTPIFADVTGRVLVKSTNPSYVGNDTWGTEENICTLYNVTAGTPEFTAALELERGKWDRVALCGVVPVNIAGLTSADIGKFLIPCAAVDGTITATAVNKNDLTLANYVDCLGTIEMIGSDGRPLVNVKTA